PILENLVTADHAGVVEVERLALRFGPEHEGRVAVRSPGDRDWARPRPIFDEAVLGQDAGRIRLGGRPVDEAEDAIAGAHERRVPRTDELRIVNGGVRKSRRGRRLLRTRWHREQEGKHAG